MIGLLPVDERLLDLPCLTQVSSARRGRLQREVTLRPIRDRQFDQKTSAPSAKGRTLLSTSQEINRRRPGSGDEVDGEEDGLGKPPPNQTLDRGHDATIEAAQHHPPSQIPPAAEANLSSPTKTTLTRAQNPTPPVESKTSLLAPQQASLLKMATKPISRPSPRTIPLAQPPAANLHPPCRTLQLA
jgi:hypothetical protein